MNRLRVLTLSLLIPALIAGGLPVTVSLAEWARRPAAGQRKKHRHYRKYSRAWWRRHRARQRARRAAVLRRRARAEALRAAALNRAPGAAGPGSYASVSAAGRPLLRRAAYADTAVAPSPLFPFAYVAPHTWGAPRRTAAGGLQFAVRTASGREVGTATLAPVNMKREDFPAPPSPRAKAIGGVGVAALRRIVIDRMVAEGGWVSNDYVREMEGRRVFVVTAQSGAPGAPTLSINFYFTEIEGRLYSLSTAVPIELAEPAAAGSEQLMASLRAAGRGNLATQK